jgi:hypothetical protein
METETVMETHLDRFSQILNTPSADRQEEPTSDRPMQTSTTTISPQPLRVAHRPLRQVNHSPNHLRQISRISVRPRHPNLSRRLKSRPRPRFRTRTKTKTKIKIRARNKRRTKVKDLSDLRLVRIKIKIKPRTPRPSRVKSQTPILVISQTPTQIRISPPQMLSPIDHSISISHLKGRPRQCPNLRLLSLSRTSG